MWCDCTSEGEDIVFLINIPILTRVSLSIPHGKSNFIKMLLTVTIFGNTILINIFKGFEHFILRPYSNQDFIDQQYFIMTDNVNWDPYIFTVLWNSFMIYTMLSPTCREIVLFQSMNNLAITLNLSTSLTQRKNNLIQRVNNSVLNHTIDYIILPSRDPVIDYHNDSIMFYDNNTIFLNTTPSIRTSL